MSTATVHRAQAQAHRAARGTEKAARDRMAPRVGTLRAAVLRLVCAAGPDGLTALEAWEEHCETSAATRLPGLYSIAPRLSELESDGYVTVIGERTPDGQPRSTSRQVYAATPLADTWLAQ